MTVTLREQRILLATKQILLTPTARDVQGRIGPSDLGDPCNKCLASKMAGVKPKRSFSLYPWLGSCIHKMIEWSTDWTRFKRILDVNDLAYMIFGHPEAISELHIEEGIEIPGYGWIPMHIDFVLPNEGCIVDWKSSSVKKIKVYKVKGVPTENVGQTLLYIYGARRVGYSIESAVLVYIPRDAADIGEIWTKEIVYDEAEVEQIVNRAAILWQWVEAGRWEELESDPHCFTCHPGYFG